MGLHHLLRIILTSLVCFTMMFAVSVYELTRRSTVGEHNQQESLLIDELMQQRDYLSKQLNDLQVRSYIHFTIVYMVHAYGNLFLLNQPILPQ